MRNDEDTNLEEYISRKFINILFNARNILQSFWIRYSTISTYNVNRQFMVRKFKFILYCGAIFYIIFCITQKGF
jgi:hypothetical protein